MFYFQSTFSNIFMHHLDSKTAKVRAGFSDDARFAKTAADSVQVVRHRKFKVAGTEQETEFSSFVFQTELFSRYKSCFRERSTRLNHNTVC